MQLQHNTAIWWHLRGSLQFQGDFGDFVPGTLTSQGLYHGPNWGWTLRLCTQGQKQKSAQCSHTKRNRWYSSRAQPVHTTSIFISKQFNSTFEFWLLSLTLRQFGLIDNRRPSMQTSHCVYFQFGKHSLFAHQLFMSAIRIVINSTKKVLFCAELPSLYSDIKYGQINTRHAYTGWLRFI